MTNSSILDELANLNPSQSEFNTKLIRRALALVGNPQHACQQIIHIGGSNGKGSTAAFISQGLISAGFKVGRYTSPYIKRLNECIEINHQPIADEQLIQLYLEYQPLLLSQQIYLSSFEMLTLLMLVYFASQSLDYLVLECGLGGRDDATNVVKSAYSIITNISLEHTQWLGSSLAEIAEHKIAIINNGQTIIADSQIELVNALAKLAKCYTNILTKYAFSSRLNSVSFTTQLSFKEVGSSVLKQVELGLFGHFQARNFLVAYEVLQAIGLSDELIFSAARKTRWPGRLQLLQRYPVPILADAAHNADGCKNLARSLSGLCQPEETLIICSILKDKERQLMLSYYSQIATTIIFCRLSDQPRATTPPELARSARGKFKTVILANSALEALQLAKRIKPRLILISGSTYLLKNFL